MIADDDLFNIAEPRSTLKQKSRTIQLSDQPGKYNKCLAIFVGISHWILAVICMLSRNEIYFKIKDGMHTYEILFIIILSFYISGFCCLQSAYKQNIFWIICCTATNVNSLIGGIIITINNNIEKQFIWNLYFNELAFKDYGITAELRFLNVFIFIEIIVSIMGLILCLRCLCFGKINTIVVNVSEGEQIKLSDDVEIEKSP